MLCASPSEPSGTPTFTPSGTGSAIELGKAITAEPKSPQPWLYWLRAPLPCLGVSTLAKQKLCFTLSTLEPAECAVEIICPDLKVHVQGTMCKQVSYMAKTPQVRVSSYSQTLIPKEQLYRLYEQATREPYSFLFVYYLKPKNEMFHIRFEERFALEKDADVSGAQLPGQKLFASSTLINAKCENISCCTSVAAVHPPVVRRTGGFLKQMTTIYVDSRKRVAGSDSDEVDLGKSLHLQRRRLAVYKIRLADSFLLTDRGRYLYWVDARWAR